MKPRRLVANSILAIPFILLLLIGYLLHSHAQQLPPVYGIPTPSAPIKANLPAGWYEFTGFRATTTNGFAYALLNNFPTPASIHWFTAASSGVVYPNGHFPALIGQSYVFQVYIPPQAAVVSNVKLDVAFY